MTSAEQGKLALANLQRLDAEERSVAGLPYEWDVFVSGWGGRVEVHIPKADFIDTFLTDSDSSVTHKKLVLNPDLAEALADQLREAARKARSLARHHAPASQDAEKTR